MSRYRTNAMQCSTKLKSVLSEQSQLILKLTFHSSWDCPKTFLRRYSQESPLQCATLSAPLQTDSQFSRQTQVVQTVNTLFCYFNFTCQQTLIHMEAAPSHKALWVNTKRLLHIEESTYYVSTLPLKGLHLHMMDQKTHTHKMCKKLIPSIFGMFWPVGK